MKKTFRLFAITLIGWWMAGNAMAEDGHYLVGGATASGWEAGEYHRSPVAMMQKDADTWIWYGKLTTGEGDAGAFKIPSQSGNWDGYWAPAQATVLTSDWSNLSESGTGDYKFCVESEGYYKVTINTKELKIKAELLTAQPQQENGYYLIKNVADFCWFAAYIASDATKASKARLTADLDFANDGFFPLASDKFKFKGEFDGGGHTIKGINVVGVYNNIGFIRFASDGAYVHDLIIEGAFEGNAKIGGVIGNTGDNGEVKLTNIINKASVHSKGSTDANAAGLVGCGAGGVKITALNCANMGAVSGQDGQCAAFAGWTQTGTTFTNCWNGGTISNMQDNFNLYRNKDAVVASNCYDVTGNDAYTQGTKMAASTLTTGEFCYELNEKTNGGTNWRQTIGTDAHPYPIAGHKLVYATGNEYCDGTPKGTLTYSNSESSVNRDTHIWGNTGFCTNEHDGKKCGEIQPGFVTLTDGYYQINNATDLYWYAAWTNKKDASVNAKLTTDIDMKAITDFPGIGSETRNFTGIFDGQRHIISNLTMDYSREGVGLVNRAASGAKVMNVTMAASCSFKGSKAVAGLIGGLYGGGNVYIENCGNEASVETTGQNAGGICGVCFSGTILHLTNVYNVGTITGKDNHESGSLSGWMANAVIENCYSIADYPTSENTHGFEEGKQFARGDNIGLTNCYDCGTGRWGQNESEWGAAFTGRKISDPQDEAQMGAMFAGLYDGTGGSVWRMEYEGWAHPVLYDPAATVLSENVPFRDVTAGEEVDLTLKRTTVADMWNTICLPFTLSAAQVAEIFGNEAKVAALTGSEGETMLFTSTTNGIQAGKAYLVKPSEAITEKELTGITLVADAPVADVQGDLSFTGIYEPTLIAQGDLFVATDNKLQPSNGEGKLKGFRAYFKNTGNATTRMMAFSVDGGETTGIIAIDGTTVECGNAYTLGGQRVAKPTKGLYIVNGKKIVIK